MCTSYTPIWFHVVAWYCPLPHYDIACSVFGRFGFGGFGFGRQQEEEEEIRGEDIQMRIRASLKDFYVGRHITLTRVKGVYEKTTGTRQCNCRMRTVTKQLGPGMFQQSQQRVWLLVSCTFWDSLVLHNSVLPVSMYPVLHAQSHWERRTT